MNTLRFCKTTIAIAALFAAAASQAAMMSKTDYSAAKDRISADYKADKSTCTQLSGNAKDICLEQAKGKEAVARAELEYSYSGKDKDANKVAVAKADAEYHVAKEKCDDLAGNPKSVCVTEAQAAHTKGLADAKLVKKVDDAKKDAVSDKTDADFKVAREKCDSLAGDAQASCIAAAKARFNKG